MQGRRAVRTARALGVVALLAGLLAMHGLATGHHGATATPVLGSALNAGDAVAGHVHSAVLSTAEGASALLAGQHGCDDACQGGEHALALLCVAVLLAVGAGGLVLRQRTGLLPRRTGPPRRLARTSAPPRPPDLVAELCISRT